MRAAAASSSPGAVYCTGVYRPGLARRFFGHGPLSSEGQTRLGFDCLEVGEDRLGLLLDCGQAACGCGQVLGARRWGRRKLERIGLDLLIGLGRLRSEGQIRLVGDCLKDRQVLGAGRWGRRKLDRIGFDLVLPSALRLDLRRLV